MYFAGLNLNPQLSHTQGLEVISWAAVTGGYVYQFYKYKGASKVAAIKGGKVKASQVPIVARLATTVHAAAFHIPLVGYIFATAYNGFYQPDWLSDYPLPLELSIRDNSMVRTFAAIVFTGFVKLGGVVLDHLGAQWAAIGVSCLPTRNIVPNVVP